MTRNSSNSFDSFSTLEVSGKTYGYYSLKAEKLSRSGDVGSLPNSIKVLLENLLRHDDGSVNSCKDIEIVANSANSHVSHEIAYYPARVLMQDFTGVPAVVDLAAMRDALVRAGADPEKINPLSQVDLVIDHSVVIDRFASNSAFAANVELEMQRNAERYAFLKWGQSAFNNFRLVPPGTGIIHQVNLEYIARAVWTGEQNGGMMAFPDTLVGTDSHTTMINGLGVLGWGVGGIEAEAAMLGQAIPMLIPEVVGFELTGKLEDGITATDLVLRIVQMLREHGVVGKFVEFFGSALDSLPLADRATIANMAPEYGATCGFFPIDRKTIDYLELSGRDKAVTSLVEAYCKAQGMWRDSDTPDPVFQSVLHLDLGEVRPNLSGPSRPQDRVPMPELREATEEFIRANVEADRVEAAFHSGDDFEMAHGDVVVAAITSCTNTSNPAVMIGAGLVAKKAAERGLSRKPWVKTSLAPGSKVVTEYLEKTGLQAHLDACVISGRAMMKWQTRSEKSTGPCSSRDMPVFSKAMINGRRLRQVQALPMLFHRSRPTFSFPHSSTRLMPAARIRTLWAPEFWRCWAIRSRPIIFHPQAPLPRAVLRPDTWLPGGLSQGISTLTGQGAAIMK